MAYAPIIWKNKEESAVSPLNAENLNHMDEGIQEVDSQVEIIKAQIAGVLDPENIVKSWTMNPTTGLITVEWADGRIQRYDLNIEKIPVDFKMSPDGVITMRTADGTEYTADLKEYIKPYKFNDSDQITVDEDGNNVTFSVKTHSILPEMLEPNFLADCVTAKTEAEGFAETAATKAKDSEDSAILSESYAVGGTGTRPGEDADNAKYYYEQAKAVSHVEKASTDKMGIVKIPTDGTITIDSDGTIHASAAVTVDTVLDKTSPNAIANSAVATAIEDIKTDITDIETDITEINTAISGINTDIGNINTEIGEINTDIDNITTDISNLNTDLAQLSSDNADYLKKNFIDGIEGGTYDISNCGTQTANNIRARIKEPLRVSPSKTYYISADGLSGKTIQATVTQYTALGTAYTADLGFQNLPIKFTPNANTNYVTVVWRTSDNAENPQDYVDNAVITDRMSNVELTEEVGKLTLKAQDYTTPSTINAVVRIGDYPAGKNKDNFVFIGYKYHMPDSSKHYIRIDTVVLGKNDGLYMLVTSSDIANRSITIYYL